MENQDKAIAELQVKVGKIIEKVRFTKDISAKQVASELNLSLAAYRNIEKGVSEISLLRIVRIAQILNVHYTELLPVEGGNSYHNNNNGNGNNHSFIYNQIESGYRMAIEHLKEENKHLKEENRQLLAAIEKLAGNTKG